MCISLIWLVIIVLDIYFDDDSGEKVSSYCRFLWIVAVVLIAECRILFWNRMMRSDNIALCILSHFIHNSSMTVGSVYNVDVLQTSHIGVKNAVLSSFTSLVYNVLGL